MLYRLVHPHTCPSTHPSSHQYINPSPISIHRPSNPFTTHHLYIHPLTTNPPTSFLIWTLIYKATGPPTHLSIRPSIHPPSTHLFITHLSIHSSISHPVFSPSIHPPIKSFIHDPFKHPPTHTSTHPNNLSLRPPIYPPIHPCVCPPICLSTHCANRNVHFTWFQLSFRSISVFEWRLMTSTGFRRLYANIIRLLHNI